MEPKQIVELHTFQASYKEPQAPDPTDEQSGLLDISSNNNLPSVLFE